MGEVCAKIGQGEQKNASDKKSWTERRSDEQTDRYVYSQESQVPLKEQGDAWPEGVITYCLLERISAGNFFDNWS